MKGIRMKKITKQIWLYVKPYKKELFFIFLCCILCMIEAFFQPLVVQRITDQGMIQKNFEVLVFFSILLILMIFGVQVLEILQSRLLLKVKNGTVLKLHEKAFSKILRLKISYFGEQNSAEIINQLNTDISCVGILMNRGFLSLFNYVFRIFSGFVGLFYINWQMALCIIACIPVKVILLQIFSRKKEKITALSIEKNRKFYSWMSDRIMGIREVKLFDRYEKETEQFFTKKAELLEWERKSEMLDLGNSASETILQGVMTGIFYLIGGYFVCSGEMSLGSVLAFTSYSANVTGPISMLMNIKMIIAQIRPSFTRLSEFFELEEEQSEQQRKIGEEQNFISPEVLQLDQICFAYGEKKILDHVSLYVKKGERIAIVGENGSGKSTLLNLLLRFYEPQEGRILIDNQDAAQIDLQQYRAFFSVVTQFPYLFQETVRENIDCHGRHEEEELKKLMETLEMKELYKRLPKGFDTVIGVSGANLSGGEKQKLALMRAILKNSPVLILDEATSNFDHESEQWLFERGLELFQDKMVILVTHQPQYLKRCDRVYRLENGCLNVES